MTATGFLRNSMINEEGGIDPEQFRMEAMFDRMDCVGKASSGSRFSVPSATPTNTTRSRRKSITGCLPSSTIRMRQTSRFTRREEQKKSAEI